jgi:hypothetical protein
MAEEFVVLDLNASTLYYLYMWHSISRNYVESKSSLPNATPNPEEVYFQ